MFLAYLLRQEFTTRLEALAAERQIKGWSRKKKEALFRGDWQEISRLAQNALVRASTSSARTVTSMSVGSEPTNSSVHSESNNPPVHHESNNPLVRPEPYTPPVRPEPNNLPFVLSWSKDERGKVCAHPDKLSANGNDFLYPHRTYRKVRR